MFIEEIILEGFKSYAGRTVISGWDSEFNAITGLNGSGKSNVLDAICFLLGISNISHVRASNYQDLVYKRGQAGVTKATVTIVFNNTNVKASPPGYEQYRQITVTRQIIVGGKSKYLINGHVAQPRAVATFFQSVQLNVNNPHFLIMQGKITKVLNMKPPEILGMIEEAAGTRMYEDKKEAGQRIMEKKEKKLAEIQKSLNEMIIPELEKKRRERTAFLEYEKMETEIEKLHRATSLYEYAKDFRKWRHSCKEIEGKESIVRELVAVHQRQRSELEDLQAQLADVEMRIKKEMSTGSVRKCQKQFEQLDEQLIRLTTQQDLHKKAVNEECLHRDELRSKQQKLAEMVEERLCTFRQFETEHHKKEVELESKRAQVRRMEQYYHSVSTGIPADSISTENSKNSQVSTIGNPLEMAKGELQKIATDLQQISMRKTHLQRELQRNEAETKQAERELRIPKNQLAVLQKEITRLESELVDLANQDSKSAQDREKTNHVDTSSLEVERNMWMQKRENFQQELEALQTTFASLQFVYADPSPNFNRQLVHGPLCNLFELEDSCEEFALALETCAGSRLQHIVVENESVGAQLLEKGQLRRRITLVPLDKVSVKTDLSTEKQSRISAIAGEGSHARVFSALSLIRFHESVRPAMEYAFGTSLISRDSEIAKQLAFDPVVRLRCITVDGDVYDPQGTLTGGSKTGENRTPTTRAAFDNLSNLTSIPLLLRQKRCTFLKGQCMDCQANIESLQKKLDCDRKTSLQLDQLRHKIAMKRREAEAIQRRIDQSPLSICMQRAQDLQNEISDQCNSKELILQEQYCLLEQQIQQLEKHVHAVSGSATSKDSSNSSASDSREKSLQELKANLNELKSELVHLEQAFVSQHLSQFQAQESVVEQNREELCHIEEEIRRLDTESIPRLREELAVCERETQSKSTEYLIVKETLQRESERLHGLEQEQKQAQRFIDMKRERIDVQESERRRHEREILRLQEERTACEESLIRMEREYSWLKEWASRPGNEAQLLDETNVTNNDMNMSQTIISSGDYEEFKKRLVNYEQRQQELRKTVNTKVMSALDRLEKEETVLKNKVQIVQKDKEKITQTLSTLDNKKREALHQTYCHVNEDFGHILGELLPGNTAKLIPIEREQNGQEHLEAGLEVRVQLGNVWKESLTELSGGQRSLIALSLILSLLRFKPAPVYILDEIDAALDLSHTQNIGRLLKHRFKGSQFIVVSLKEGMFNQANVIFQVQYREGVSVIERIAQNSGTTMFKGNLLTANTKTSGQRGRRQKETDSR